MLTADDLAAYRPKVLQERPVRYRDTTYVTANDQVGYEVLSILEQFDLAAAGPGSTAFYHLLPKPSAMRSSTTWRTMATRTIRAVQSRDWSVLHLRGSAPSAFDPTEPRHDRLSPETRGRTTMPRPQS